MNNESSLEQFNNARRIGLKNYNAKTSSGQIGYLPSLEGIRKENEIVSYVNLGEMEIPLKKIIGTYSHLRSLCFASNFMPIISSDSEFESKWEALYKAHISEGIRDSIKVYEYLNWYYVIEGNKRVSVLKYVGAYSIQAEVTRMIPKMEPGNYNIELYYEFLKFYNITKINSIWFTRKSSFMKMAKMLQNYNPKGPHIDNKFKYFDIYIYNVFRRIYHEIGGAKLAITTGDAFLEYAKIYGIPSKIHEVKLKKTLVELIKELQFYEKDEFVDIITKPEENSQGGVISTISTFFSTPKKLKIAFVYARTIDSSGWTYGHELGRQYIEKTLGSQITTSYIENVPEDKHAYESIKALAEDGNDVIFTTSPVFKIETLKCALEYPEVKFFNCSEFTPYKHLSNYYGRTYEPRFLTGIIAGSMTKTDIVGYAATSPTPEVISCINAFALGARMVNPYVKVNVAWTMEWNSHSRFSGADEKLMNNGADIISNRNLSFPRDVSKKYGVFSMLSSMDFQNQKTLHHLAAPIWNWGVFYEKITRSILNNTYKTILDMFSSNSKLVNFWWGMESGVLDIYFSKDYLPAGTQKLVNLMKEMIKNNDYHPFTGPISDSKGDLRIEDGTNATHEQILNMNWFINNVDAEPYKKL